MLKRIGPSATLAILIGCLASTVFAQGGNAVINGTVYDQAKAVLPGATVTVTNEATGITREATSGAEGQYVIPTLVPGTYTVRTELAGFQGQAREGIVLRIGQELTIDLTMTVAGVAEKVVVTGEAPIIETTASRIGAVVSEQEIDQLPSQGRNHLSLMQLVPGLVPELTPGEFEGGNFNVNGRDIASNLWTVDGAANQDTDGGGTGPQARITLDSMAEFQVLTHQYTAEFGGSSGVIINAVTKSGSNVFSGRGFYYFEDESLRARDPFLDPDEEKPEAGRKTFGFNVGGPIVRNKAFFFFNAERNLIENAVVHTMPPEAAPLAVSYADATFIRALSTFARVDYTAGANNFSFRWQREVAPAVGEDFECCQTLDNRQIELDSNDRMFNVGWTRLIGNRATNEFKFSHVGEDRVDGNLAYMNVPPANWNTSGWISDLEYVGLNGRDQFDIGSRNAYADFDTGLAAAHGGADSRNYTIQNTFTYVTNGAHTFKAGFTWNRPMVRPQRIGANDNGTFTFRHNLPFNPANPSTYPSRFSIVMGDIEVDSEDDWWNGFVQDQWRVTPTLTLNLGLRYDRQDLTPETTAAFAPRLGFAYDPRGEGRTVIRGGIGKFYEYHLVGVANNLNRRGVFGQTFTFDTGEDTAADSGVIPAHACLQPIASGALAAISPACRAMLTGIRNSLQPGAGTQFINTEPQLDGDRRMGYLWAYSVGLRHELFRDLAVGVDYVGNRGYDQTAQIDINEGPVGPNGRITRPGPAVFDPTGELIPPSARGAMFQRVLQYQTRDDFNSDFDSLELSLEKRFTNRWSARAAYTLAYANDVVPQNAALNSRVSNDLNPREDYARATFDNRHAFVASLNVNPFGGFNTGAIVRYYSGYPINETIGSDVNGDRDNNDRPVRGVHDLTMPILSPLDENGRAIRNGIDGNSTTLVDLQLQYVFRLQQRQSIGLFAEIYNLFNTENLGNPTGNRNNRNFMVPVEAGAMRSAQLGVRYTF
jgi:outer membrane receptor protein involved in Fe transport